MPRAGLLSIALAKLGVARVVATDGDEAACKLCRVNAAANGVGPPQLHVVRLRWGSDGEDSGEMKEVLNCLGEGGEGGEGGGGGDGGDGAEAGEGEEGEGGGGGGAAPLSLEACLGAVTAAHTLRGEDQFHCDRCGGKRDATRACAFGVLPPTLLLQALATYCLLLHTYLCPCTDPSRLPPTLHL